MSRLVVESELQLPANSTAIAMLDPSHVCGLHHSSRQCQILSPLSEAKDRTHILMDTSQIRFRCATVGTPETKSFELSPKCFLLSVGIESIPT